MFRFTPDRVPTGPRAFFLAFTATGSVDRAGRELECVAGEAPTAALGFGPHLLWRIEPATPGEDMPRCSSGWWPHLWRALTLPARPRVSLAPGAAEAPTTCACVVAVASPSTVDHSILLLSLLCWRLATDSCHGLVVAPTDEQHLTSEASPSTRRHRALEQSAASSAHAGCGAAGEQVSVGDGGGVRHGRTRNVFTSTVVPERHQRIAAACPRSGENWAKRDLPMCERAALCTFQPPLRLILAPYRQMSTLLQQRHSQPHACPPRIGRCASKRGRRGVRLSWPCSVTT